MEQVYLFDFDKDYYIQSFAVKALHIDHAIDQFNLIFGTSCFREHVICVSKIN